MTAGRALAIFWIVVIFGGAAGAGVLQRLGPPGPETADTAPAADSPGAPSDTRAEAQVSRAEAQVYGPPRPEPPRQSTPTAPAPPRPGQPIPGPIAALVEPAVSAPAGLPRIAADGRAPMHAYAGGIDLEDTRPRVALLFGGIGLSESDSEDAIRAMPAPVSFVVSPYAARPERLLADMRARGHEYLLGLPMEPKTYPTDDPGNQALLTSLPPAQNIRRLDWSLTRFAGYAGVTNAADGLRGERFAASPLMSPVLQQLARRGLFYIDSGPARPADSPATLVARGIDLVMDEPAVRTEIDSKLATLERMARDRGAAIGLATLPRPVTIDRIAAWAAALSDRGIALVPVSAVAAMPRAQASRSP